MDLINEAVVLMANLVMKSFSIAMVSASFIMRSICLLILSWMELCMSLIFFQLNVLWKTIICASGILSLPVRALTALRREKMLEMRLQDILVEVENLINDKIKLDHRFHVVVNQHRFLQDMYAELEDEHNEVVCKLEQLQSEFEILKIENQRLQGTKDKAVSQNTRSEQKWKDGKDMNNDKTSPMDIKKVIPAANEHQIQTSTLTSEEHQILRLRREDAVFRTAFSLLMSLLVGLVAFQAQKRCTPLLVALFSTTFMSFKSVLKYFIAINNRLANHAVVLIGLNCFILGTLTCPTIATIGHMLSMSLPLKA